MHNIRIPLDFKQFSRPDTQDEYETFGDNERLAREHAEYFSEDYADVYPVALL